ncbi:MAG: trigger factor [Candidatus Latescibacterota bacterium]
MKSEITERVGCRKKLHVEVEQERLEREVQATLKNLRKEVQIPGFRKGKAPEEMLLRRFGGGIRQEALKEMLPKVLEEVFEAQGIKPVGEPEVSELHLDENAPVTFDVAVEEMPEVDIEAFKTLEVTREVVEVTGEDVEAALERLRRMRAVQEEVDREIRDGDIIIANLQKLDPTGVPIIGDRLENRVIHLDGKSTPSPDFDRQVVGMRKGERRNIRITYDESVDESRLAGTTEGYEVEVMRIYENRLPELTDEFVQSLGGYTDVSDLREKTRAGLVRQYESMSERKLRSALIEEYVRQNPFEVPNSMIERVIHSQMENLKKEYPDEQIDEAALHSRIRPDAVRAVQTYILIEEIKKKQGMEVSRDEVNEQIDKEAQARNINPRELRRTYIKDGLLDDIKNEIAQEKAYDWLKSVVTVKEEVIPREAPQSRIITP